MVMSHDIRNSSLSRIDELTGNRLNLFSDVRKTYLDFFNIRCQQSKACKSSRSDSKALSCSGCSVAECIKYVCTLAYLRIQFAHLSVSSGIIRNRTICVGREGNTQRREHSDCSDTNAIETEAETLCRERKIESVCTEICKHDCNSDCNYRNCSREHTKTYTGDDNSRRAGLCRLRQLLGRSV